jgi:hypothetical protein
MSKKVEHFFFNRRSCGREQIGEVTNKIAYNFSSVRNPSPLEVFRKFTALDLLLIKVEEWKNLVLRSLHCNQVSLDFDLHKCSSFFNRDSCKLV